jgi:hypothetical protein
MNTKGKWTNETLDGAMDIIENGTTSLWKGLGIMTYILFHWLITCTKKQDLGNLGKCVC